MNIKGSFLSLFRRKPDAQQVLISQLQEKLRLLEEEQDPYNIGALSRPVDTTIELTSEGWLRLVAVAQKRTEVFREKNTELQKQVIDLRNALSTLKDTMRRS